ncbi:MAG: BrnT family toxin, partial [Spirochaetaceae bacterium]|nr:BrnT family toxin [Spirochaetaceae bacterium]
MKHKIGFEDAQFVFADPDRIERIDRSESNTSGETRWQTIGRVGSLLFVVYTERGEGTCLVTAREAEKHERRSYNGYYH